MCSLRHPPPLPAEMSVQLSSTCIPIPPISLRMSNCRTFRFGFFGSEWFGSVNSQMGRCWSLVVSDFNASYCLVPAVVGSVLLAGTDLQLLVINVPIPSLHMGMGEGG